MSARPHVPSPEVPSPTRRRVLTVTAAATAVAALPATATEASAVVPGTGSPAAAGAGPAAEAVRPALDPFPLSAVRLLESLGVAERFAVIEKKPAAFRYFPDHGYGQAHSIR